MTPWQQLDLSNLRVLDGAMATELERRGCDISGPLWSARVLDDAPEAIEQVHRDYLLAGADCLLTASYQISFAGYGQVGLQPEDAAAALRKSVQLAVDAREEWPRGDTRPVWIAASLGPYGAALHNGAEYHGNYGCSFEDLVRFHSGRLEILQNTRADLVAFETVPSLEEARAIVTALRQFAAIGAWVSFTCRDGRHVAHGETIAACGELLDEEEQVLAIGINCTAPHWVSSLIGGLKSTTRKPVLVYPNSGETWDAERRCWLGQADAGEFGHWAREWLAAGAQAVGGCCRTGPDHVRAVRAVLA